MSVFQEHMGVRLAMGRNRARKIVFESLNLRKFFLSLRHDRQPYPRVNEWWLGVYMVMQRCQRNNTLYNGNFVI